MIRSEIGRGRRCVAVATAAAGWLCATNASAQIDAPGQHIRYGMEIEPQLSLQHARVPGEAAGIGPGLRLSVPIISDGPLKKLNNSLALGVGVNWAIFKESCGTYFWDGPAPEPDEPQYPTYAKGCTAHQITAPVVIQWNFWITEVVSVFAEPGMAFLYERRSGTGWCDGEPCSKKDSSTKLPFVLWGGARMAMSESLALTIRLGTPYVSAGASLFF